MNERQKWLEVTVAIDDGSREAVANFLFESGSCGLEEGSEFVRAFYEEIVVESELRSSIGTFLESLRNQGVLVEGVTFRWMEAEDWSKEWRRFFRPIQVTPRIVVKPSWKSWNATENNIVIDIMPRMAFGTGTHETTQLCLEMMEGIDFDGASVLDVGTGSGILAVAAAKMEAFRILGVDVDEAALKNASENAHQNRVAERIEIRAGSLDVVGSETYDVIVANINRAVLEGMIPCFSDRFNRPGTLLLSGLLIKEAQRILELLKSLGYTILEELKKGEWMGISARLA